MNFIELTNVSKEYLVGQDHSHVKVLDDFNLSIHKEHFVSLFGPNGCGKSTILNIIANLVPLDKGLLRVGDALSSTPKTSFIFQNSQDTLLPWRTCLGNLTFPLELSGYSRNQAREKALAFLATVKLELPLRKYPYQLSGGQKQLLGLCRAFIHQPQLLLMDEPFSALDYDRRTRMEQVLLSLLEGKRVTTVFVSHEVDEAIYLADRVIVLTPAPVRIGADIKIDLPRPRDLTIMNTSRFSELRAQVIAAFQRKGDE